PFELPLEEVEPFHIADDRGLPCLMRGLEIGRRKCPVEAMAGNHLIHPGEALDMVLIEQARLRRAQRGEDALSIPAEDRTIRYVRQACGRERPCPHGVREIVAGGRL